MSAPLPTPDKKLTKLTRLIRWLRKGWKEFKEDEIRHGNWN